MCERHDHLIFVSQISQSSNSPSKNRRNGAFGLEDEQTLGAIVDEYLDSSSDTGAQNALSKITCSDTAFSENEKEDTLRDLLDRFLAADPRYHRTEQLSSILQMLGDNTEDGFAENIPKVVELVQWWNHVLDNMEQPDTNLSFALDMLVNEVLQNVSKDQKRELLPTFARIIPTSEMLTAISDTNRWLLNQPKGVISSYFVAAGSVEAAEYVPCALGLLEKEIQDRSLIKAVFHVLYSAYDAKKESIEDSIDAVIERTVQGCNDLAVDGGKLISRVAQTSPRLLYSFVDHLSSVLHQVTSQETRNMSARGEEDVFGAWA